MKIIGLTGSMGTGKSTALQIIKEQTGRSCRLIKFAGPLYEIQEQIYGVIASVYQRPADFIKDRKLLQWVGTEWGRSIDKDIWLKLWTQQVDFLSNLSGGDVVIVADDVRYDNEAEVIKKKGGKIIKLERTTDIGIIDNGTAIEGHISELGIHSKYVDALIKNNGTKEDFKSLLIQANDLIDLW